MSDFAREDLFDTAAIDGRKDQTLTSRVRKWRFYFNPIIDAFQASFARQAPHAVLWWPVGVAVGVGLFFALPFDPPMASGLVALVSILFFRWVFASHFGLRIVLFALALSALGFIAAQIRTENVAAPMLGKEVGPAFVSGTVIMVEPRGRNTRVTLDRLSISELEQDGIPHRVRVSLPASHGAPETGQRIKVRAVLRPPGRPVAPGAFDFQRHSFFRQLGGVGFAVGTWQALNQGPLDQSATSLETWSDQIGRLRASVGDRFSAALPGESGTIARALVTGERNAVPEPLQEAYRQAGLAHMLAISGLHMSLLTGLVFVFLRYGLALIRPVAERYDTKKIAAGVALAAAAFYLILSGMNVPAQRAFIMISVVLFAVLMDRTALSLRTLAWAAMAVLLLQPDSLVGASFQLSFAAVVALIAVYEKVHIRASLWDTYGNFRLVRAVVLYCAAVIVTDLIATSATGPFTAFHFHRVPSYSLLANLLAGPIMGLWIMPFGLLALLLMPFGLEGVPLVAMGAGIDVVDMIARFVAGLPGATLHTPPGEVWALVCTALGALFLCLWKGYGRLAGLIPLGIGLLQPWLARPPDILVNETAEVYAVQGSDENLVFSPGRKEGFTRDVWTERWGKSAEPWSEGGRLTCDSVGCLYELNGKRVSLAFSEPAVSEDCGNVDLIVAKVPSWRLCNTGARIDRFDVWRHGAHAVWLGDDDIRVERVSDFTGKRVWNRSTWR